jgi:type IV pilus assembly protein PilV
MKTIILTQGSRSVPLSQRGVGMIEVLVAMLLLAIGVLGYAALQIRAVEATGEALNRSQAMVVLRSLAENMRVNISGQASYTAAVHTYASMTSATTAPPTCMATSSLDNNSCTPAVLAAYDAFQAGTVALKSNIHLDMYQCPGVSAAPVKRQCLFAAWGKTNPVISSATPLATDCMDSTGAYVPTSTCLMMEAY